MAKETVTKELIRERITEIIKIGRRLWLRGMVAANDGNISCRIGEGYLITRSGISKGFMLPEDILLLDSKGCPLQADSPPASMETGLHLALYAPERKSELWFMPIRPMLLPLPSLILILTALIWAKSVPIWEQWRP